MHFGIHWVCSYLPDISTGDAFDVVLKDLAIDPVSDMHRYA
jgi:hypothetical protein